MRFSGALLAASSAFVGSASAVEFTAGSRFGMELMKHARSLNQNGDELWMYWVPNYSVQFKRCHALIQVAAEENGGGNDEGGMLYTQHLTEFSLCPEDSCEYGKSCKYGGSYVVDTRLFVEMYRQFKEEECEQVRENCYCDNANDDQACENMCFMDAGLDDCVVENEEDGQEQQEVERYMECEMMEQQNNNGNGNGWNAYYIGPWCTNNGREIRLAVFQDDACSVLAEEGTYENYNYGYSLPYSYKSMVDSECISCKEVDEDQNDNNNNNNNNNNGNDQQDEDRVIDMCEQLYQASGKCEENVQGLQYYDNSACNYLQKILPRLENASKSVSSGGGGSSKTAVVFAWVFGIMAVLLGVYAFLLYRRLKRSKVDLSSDGP